VRSSGKVTGAATLTEALFAPAFALELRDNRGLAFLATT